MRKFWWQGPVKEGSKGLLRHGFRDLGFQRISAKIGAVSKASRAAMASFGMEQVKTLHPHHQEMMAGAEADEVPIYHHPQGVGRRHKAYHMNS